MQIFWTKTQKHTDTRLIHGIKDDDLDNGPRNVANDVFNYYFFRY